MSHVKPAVLTISQNYYLRGGSDCMFFETAKLFEERGHRVIPFTAADPRNRPTPWAAYFPVAASFENPGPIDLVRFVYSRPAARAIRKLLKDHKPDVAHVHIYYGKLTSSILAPLKEAGVPIVQTLHEYKLICPVYTLISNGTVCEACQGHHFWRAIPRKCNRSSAARTLLSVTETYVSRFLGSVDSIDHFIAVSDFVRTKMIEHGIPPQKISTVHNFVDASRGKANHQAGEYLLYFGRLERLKGVFTLLEAAAPLTQVPLLIVGEGSARAEIAEMIERRNLKHIQLLGFKRGDELERLIGGSLCAMVPSEWYEPLPTTVIEAFTHARPVVASRIGGISEIVTHGVDGFLVEAGNAEALRERMNWLATHPHEAVQMGLAGRKMVEERFGAEVYYANLMRVYQSVL
jgi:glycosyltransferase involved in cell wall biosynthesis